MAGCAASVVVRFGDTLVMAAHVRAGARFVVGRTRDADVALDIAPFALVESTPSGFVVRTAADVRPHALDEPFELAIGAVRIDVALVERAPPPVARRAVDRRPLWFAAGSLAAHAAVLLLAMWLASSDDRPAAARADSKKRPVRIARFAVAAQTVKRAPKPAPQDVPITADDTPNPTPSTDAPRPASARSSASVQTPNGRGDARVKATVESRESHDESVQGRGFDPGANPAFDTVKVGNYATIATGSRAGASYRLDGENGRRRSVIVVSCDSSSCVIIGGDKGSGVREALEARLGEIVGCYEQHAHAAGKKVELDFGVDGTGKVDAVNVGGVGDYDSCVANVIKRIAL